MQSWPEPDVPSLPGTGPVPHVHDTATGGLRAVPGRDGRAALYVCGITPYDSTHLGHAATYLAFDTLVRAWRDAGVEVDYAQNVTDVDDPLLERAEQTGVDWRDLARGQIDRFTTDMEALRVVPPRSYVGVVESIDDVVAAVSAMLAAGAAYVVGTDVYADLRADDQLGSVSHLSAEQMAPLFAERGGDPDTPGKRDPLDPLVWRGRRDGEPSWPGGDLGEGRPGWHVECAAIARRHLGTPITVQGGGSDLIYPHHEMSTSHLRQCTGAQQPIDAFVHTGLVGYDGHKMSKSRGNLVLVSQVVADGVPAPVLRLAVLAQHYRADWEYRTSMLFDASRRWLRWREAAHAARDDVDESDALAELRARVADDLDTPGALRVVDAWARRPRRGRLLAQAADALLGVDLTPEA